MNEQVVGGAGSIPIARAVPDEATNVTERFPREIGERTHRVVGELARLGQDLSEMDRTELAWTLAIQAMAERPLSSRLRAGRLMIAGNAAVYGRFLLPPKPWWLVGSEVPTLDGGRLDLVWEHPDGRVMYDELKITMGARDPMAMTATREQSGRYLADGMARHAAFVGVRICALGAPRHSRLLASGRLLRVCETEFWFEPSSASGGAS